MDAVYDLKKSPPVLSIIIPNRNGFALLSRCVEVLNNLDVLFELIIVDNASDDPSILELYRQLATKYGARVLEFNCTFNYSRMINAGAFEARGAYLLLLNNDVFIPDPMIINQALRYAMQPDVGVVGSILRYPDGSIQHAGIVLHRDEGGQAYAEHILRYSIHDEGVYIGALSTPKEWQAVTGAFQLIKRSTFADVGGYDETNLPVEHNDIDFCLRVRDRGLKVVCLPLKDVVHAESATRAGMDTVKNRRLNREAREFMSACWSDAFAADPYHISTQSVAPRWKLATDFTRLASHQIDRARQRLFFGSRTSVQQEQRKSELESILRLPRRLSPGLCIVGADNPSHALSEFSRNFVTACKSVKLPVTKLLISGEHCSPNEIADLPAVWRTDRRAVVCISSLEKIGDRAPVLGEGRYRIACIQIPDQSIPGYQESANEYDEIWVTSQCLRERLLYEVSKPVHVIPQPLTFEDPCLVVGEPGEVIFVVDYDASRSWYAQNLEASIAAFKLATNEESTCRLVISVTGALAAKERRRIAQLIDRDRRITLVSNRAWEDANNRQSMQVYLSLQRSDCSGLGVYGAMMKGRPVVAIRNGAAVDYLEVETAFPVQTALKVGARHEDSFFLEPREPDMDSAIEAIRAIVRNPSDAVSRAAKARRVIEDIHSPLQVGLKVQARLRSVGAV